MRSEFLKRRQQAICLLGGLAGGFDGPELLRRPAMRVGGRNAPPVVGRVVHVATSQAQATPPNSLAVVSFILVSGRATRGEIAAQSKRFNSRREGEFMDHSARMSYRWRSGLILREASTGPTYFILLRPSFSEACPG